MKRRWYANLASGAGFSRITDAPCQLCGGRVFEYGQQIPAQYIVNPPYKRKPHPLTLPSERIGTRECEKGCWRFTEAW